MGRSYVIPYTIEYETRGGVGFTRAAWRVRSLVETYSPGDGVTRYRFFKLADLRARGYDPATQTYFGPASGTYTALGLKEAWAFLTGARSNRGGR